jgi:hypothetical protein
MTIYKRFYRFSFPEKILLVFWVICLTTIQRSLCRAYVRSNDWGSTYDNISRKMTVIVVCVAFIHRSFGAVRCFVSRSHM